MMETLRPRLRAIGDRIDAMSLRERAIIFVALLTGVYLTADQMVLKPLGIERDRMQLQLKTRHEQIQSYERQLQVMLTGTDDPGSPVAQKILALQQQLSTLDDILSKSTGGLVSPRDMARLVEEILSRHRQLTVVRLESLAPEPIREAGAAAPAGSAATPQTPAAGGESGLYKHGMRIVVKGTYHDLLAYLRTLEGLQWKVFWGKVALEAEVYPVSQLTLELYTLSTHKGWIGL
ncbi:MAG: hypothetical protein A2140_00305 [Candidatus Muproteobacteria bacterium RBG_16_62_13]|uniref:MSHA biogenesis protein MshJ n=1 Tax=Candidatus Muproteobacteria bacterium RBG_16_62_13 TaxID=1817756 RepID=A0A1F6T714_9PROT|nr:MAG: hypothetical protein A2140_00305 [Candidatus Muproteobacteria bacterium RBG_16_62_13]